MDSFDYVWINLDIFRRTKWRLILQFFFKSLFDLLLFQKLVLKTSYNEAIKSLINDITLHVNSAIPSKESHAHFLTLRVLYADYATISSWKCIVWNLLFDVCI